VVGGMLIPGAAASKLVTRQMIRDMKRSVIVDVTIAVPVAESQSRP